MSSMFKEGEFFVRLYFQGERPELTIWNQHGTKIISEFVGSTTPNFWTQIATHTSQNVVDRVQALLPNED